MIPTCQYARNPLPTLETDYISQVLNSPHPIQDLAMERKGPEEDTKDERKAILKKLDEDRANTPKISTWRPSILPGNPL